MRFVLIGCCGWLIACVAASIGLPQDVGSPANEPAAQPSSQGSRVESPTDSGPSSDVPPAIRAWSGRIQYVGPDTFILLDAEGRPQPVPGMTYEDFMTAWKQAHNAAPANRQPRFVIEDVRIDGTTDNRHATLKYALTVRLLTDEPIAVPLGLGGAILQGQARFERKPSQELRVESQEPEENSSAERQESSNNQRIAALDSRLSTLDFPAELLAFDAERGGLVAWFVGRPGERHTLSLDALVPLSRDGAETFLLLGCPRALSSRLTVEVRPTATEASTTSGTLMSSTPTAGGVRLEVAGFAGQFRLSWKSVAEEAPELTTVLSAAGGIQMSIDGRSVRTTARLTVRSYGGGFDRFRVRLPPGAKLIQEDRSNGGPAADYRVSIEAETTRGGGPPRAAAGDQIVLVRWPEKQSGPVVVDLSAEQPLGPLGSSSPLELAGFEVLGAVRQYGDIALRVADDWQLRWDAGRYVRQVDPSELDSRLQQGGLTAAFQYDRQPWSLGVLVAARRYRIHVTPQYELECLPDEARLRVQLAYQVLGARAFEFRVDLKDWELTADPVESGGLVDRDRVQVTSDGTLILPLTQAATRRAEISFLVRRATPRDVGRISLPLPVPAAESVGTGELVVRSAAGLELTPDLLSSTGLTPTPVTDTMPQDSTGGGVEFRFHCFPVEAVFAADRASRSRDVSTETLTRVDITPTEIRIDQRFDYTVRFEPIQELMLEIPDDLPFDAAEADVVLLTPAGEGGAGSDPLETPLRLIVAASAENGAADGGDPRATRIVLPQPRLGRFSVRLRVEWNRAEGAPVVGPMSVPLLSPAEGRMAAHRAIVAIPRDLAVALDPAAASSWQAASDDSAGSREFATANLRLGAGSVPLPYALHPVQYAQSVFVAGQPQTVLPLVISAVDLSAPSATIVERLWLQTWITGTARQDRAAFRLRSLRGGESRVTLELPPQTPPTEVEVLLDGQPADVTSRDTGRLVVRIDARSTHTLELRYRQFIDDPIVARWRLTPPQLVGATSLSEVYWQIVLPEDQHVVRPPQLTPASRWQWLGSFWGRRPTKSQAELEQWAGATSGLAPSARQSEYLFSGLGPVASIEMVTAPRWLIVLAASGAVLALALVWIYVPIARRGWIVFAAACVLAGLAVAFPTPAALICQAAVVGVILATLAIWIGRLASRPAHWRLPIVSGSTQRHTTPRGDVAASPIATLPSATSAPSSSVAARRAGESMR